MQGGQSAHYPRPTAKAGRAPARGVAQLPLIGALFGSQVTATKDRRTRPPIRRVGDPPTTPPRPTAKAGRAPARGVAQLPLIGALYGSQVIATKDRRTRPPKRQPVMPKACRRIRGAPPVRRGLGRRSPGFYPYKGLNGDHAFGDHSMKQIEIDLDVSREIEVARLSFSETENDILRRLLRIGWSEGSSVSRPEEQIGQRSTGTFSFTYKRERFREASLKTAYKRLLLLIHADNSDFLSDGRAARSTWTDCIQGQAGPLSDFSAPGGAIRREAHRRLLVRHEPFHGSNEITHSSCLRCRRSRLRRRCEVGLLAHPLTSPREPSAPPAR
jgi:hypothetical protein